MMTNLRKAPDPRSAAKVVFLDIVIKKMATPVKMIKTMEPVE